MRRPGKATAARPERRPETRMTRQTLALRVLPERFAVCRIGKDDPAPSWASAGGFFSITRTADELSIVCPEQVVPQGVRCENGWGCLQVAGTLALSMVGVLASLATPLAEVGISVFAISTFDTD